MIFFFVFLFAAYALCNDYADDEVNKKEPILKTKIKTFNPRFIALEKNKRIIRKAALWAFIPCGGFIYLHDYSYIALFGSYMLVMGGVCVYSLYRWWDMSKQHHGTKVLSYVYWTGGLFFLGYILNIIVSIISAKMKIFDGTRDLSVVVKPSDIGKLGGLTLNLNIDTKNL